MLKEIENKIDRHKIVLEQYKKFVKYTKKERDKYFVFFGVIMLVSMFYITSIFFIFFSIIETFITFLILLKQLDIRNLNKRIDENIKKMNELTEEKVKEIEIENSYPKTKMIRLLSPYHNFKADMIDDKIVIKEKQGKKMVITGEKTIDEVVDEFKKLIVPYTILKAQICERTDYDKDNFKWREIENIIYKFE